MIQITSNLFDVRYKKKFLEKLNGLEEAVNIINAKGREGLSSEELNALKLELATCYKNFFEEVKKAYNDEDS